MTFGEKGIKLLGQGVYLGACALLSALVLGSFFQVGINGHPPSMIREVVDGTSHKPFVYRRLVPATIQQIEKIMPGSVKEQMLRLADTPLLKEAFLRYRWEPEHAVIYFSAAGLLFLSLLLFVHAFSRLAQTQYEMPVNFRRGLSLVALAMLPCCFRYYGYLYDFPNLVLFTYALGFMAAGRKGLYFLIFPLTVFSKETSVLLIFIFALYFRRACKTPRFAGFIFAQILIYAGIKAYLQQRFSLNPGGALEMHLGHNLTLKPYNFGQYGALLAIIILCAKDWHGKPRFLRDALWMLVPLLGPAVVFGMLDEYRAFYEAWPTILLLAVPPVAQYLQVQGFKNKTPLAADRFFR